MSEIHVIYVERVPEQKANKVIVRPVIKKVFECRWENSDGEAIRQKLDTIEQIADFAIRCDAAEVLILPYP